MSNQYKYRFRTEEEFIKQFGQDWRPKLGFFNDMDYLLGMVLRLDVDEKDFNYFGYWLRDKYQGRLISHSMVIEIKSIEPNYKPKKFIREI
jgi:hypothetical protein